jgi:FdhD protein
MMGPRGATRTVGMRRYRDTASKRERDAVAVEEPLEIRLSWTEPDGSVSTEALAVTMRTPGDDFDLVAGFLHGEGVVQRPEHLLEMSYCRGEGEQRYNVVEARLRPGVPFDGGRVRRNFYTSSSCGVCGKASIEAVEAHGCQVLHDEGFRVPPGLLARLPSLLQEGQGAFRRTGGLHAAALFDAGGHCRVVREDVGRHNAVDKALGQAFLRRALPAGERILVVSGRASFEIVQKSVVAGVPVLVAVGAPSSLAVELATRFQQTLVGFARDGGFNVYAAPERIA